MSGALGGFAAGLLSGINTGLQRERERKLEEERLAREEQRFQWEKDQHDQKMADDAALRQAATPVQVSNGATVTGLSDSPTLYDNADVAASDVRQARMLNEQGAPTQDPGSIALSNTTMGGPPAASPAPPNPTMTPTPVVNGKGFSTQADAQAAADTQNTPGATADRIALALRKQGKVTEALQYQQAAQKYADDQWERELRDAMAGGHQGIADLLTKSGAGPVAGKKIAATPSADGKSVTYNVVNDDGTLTPTGYTFPNDQNGVIQAGYALSKVSPEVRYQHMVEANKTLAQQDAKARELDLREHLIKDVQIPLAQARATAEQARSEAAAAKAQNGDKPPVGYRRTANGNLEAIPGGPADQKLQGQFNQDTAALMGSITSFDRLASAANEVLNHPGLEGITGWRGKLPNAPGSDAANAEALLATLKSQVGFSVLQDMRNNSKTGGALGAVSDAEGKRLEANLAALDKSQSLEQFKKNLQKIIDYSEQAKDRMREAFNMRHADRQGQPSGPGTPAPAKPSAPAGIPTVKTQADVAKLPAGSLFIGPDGVTRRKP